MGSKEKRGRVQNHQGSLDNLLYWLKILYRKSPGFVWTYVAGIGITVGISLLGVYMPSVLVADITHGETVGRVLADLGLLGGGLLCLNLLSFLMNRAAAILECKISYGQGLDIAQAAMEADYADVERSDFPGEFRQLISRHMWEKTYTFEFMEAFRSLATAIIGMVLYVGMLSGLSWWILLLVVCGTAVNYTVGICCNRWDAANHRKWHDLDNKMFYLARSTSTYEASKDVHVYHMPPWLRGLFDRALKQRLRYTVRQQANFYVEAAVGGFARMIWEGAAYLYLIYKVCAGELDAAGFVLYFGVITGFAVWCDSIISGMRALHKNAIFVGEERRYLDKMNRGGKEDVPKSGADRKPGAQSAATGKGGREELVLGDGHIPEISFANVSFRYDGAESPTIKNLNLTLRPGENIALVGLNGAGKTTFIKLLCGFYDPTEGEILIDGVNRLRYSRESWFRYFSGVFQDAGLFPISLGENLVLGGDAGKAEVEEGLRMADLEGKIRKLPEGLQTMFGVGSNEDAVDFSGGELQKMLLARALCKKSPLLVLDEPTAALDPLMESELYERYCRFSENRTTVFISHRLASTRFCDRVLLMEEGVVAEEGTHQELLDRDGKYAWMFRLQSRYYRRQQERKEAGLEGEEAEIYHYDEKGGGGGR